MASTSTPSAISLQDLLLRLKAKRCGNQWKAECPAHFDKTPSLSITERSGKILLYCHARCSVEAICDALGISVTGLFTDTPASRKIERAYDYLDEQGRLLYQVVRYVPKGFSQRRPDGNGGWIPNLKGVRRILYRLPAVLASEEVIIAEGEKDADSLCEMGFVATSNPGGAGKWQPEFNEFLRGKKAAIVGDADAPGRNHARSVARSLIGIASQVKLIETLPLAKDITEWREKGGTKEQLLAMIEATPALALDDVKEASETRVVEGFVLIPLGDLLAKPDTPCEFVWHGHLVAGTVSAVASKPKVGKSTFARNLCLAVARGEDFLGRPTKQGQVVYLALEEREEEVRNDFAALGADGSEPIWVSASMAPEEGITALCALVRERRPRLIVIDPLIRLARVRDENGYAEMYAAFGPLIEVARETGAHLMLLHHCGKSMKSDAIDAPLGSTAIGGAVATLIILKRTEAYRTIQTVQRVAEDMPETVLEFCTDTRRLSVTGDLAEFERGDCEARILEFLKDSAQPQTQQDLRKGVEGKTQTIRAAITSLVQTGRVQKTGSGRRGDPCHYELPSRDSLHNAGTREPECHRGDETRMVAGEILVPENSQSSILVPGEFDSLKDADSSTLPF